MSTYILNETALLEAVPAGLLIGGVWRPAVSGRTFDVDPATGKVLLSAAIASAEDGVAALDAAVGAQESWAAVSDDGAVPAAFDDGAWPASGFEAATAGLAREAMSAAAAAAVRTVRMVMVPPG